MKLILLLISCSLVSCLPNRLVPNDYSIEKNNIEAYIEVDSVTIAMQNLKVKGDHYVFGLEIVNNSAYPIFIDHTQIRKHAHHLSYAENDTTKWYQEVVAAMNPAQVNTFFRGKKRDGQVAAAFLFIVGAAIIANDAIKDQRDSQKEEWTEKDEKRSFARDIFTSTSLIATDVLSTVALVGEEAAEIELQYLPDELFTKKVLYPGETYFGKVLFRKPGEVQKHHRIVWPVEGVNYQFDFRKATPAERRYLHERGQ